MIGAMSMTANSSLQFYVENKYILRMKKNNLAGMRKLKSGRKLIVNEFGGQYEEGFDDVKLELRNCFTGKAVRTVLYQLYEMNPPQYIWLHKQVKPCYSLFIAENDPGDGKRFLRNLAKEYQDLAERVMITRLHLYSKWIKQCDHAEIYKEISDENLELMRGRLLETIVWPVDENNTE